MRWLLAVFFAWPACHKEEPLRPRAGETPRRPAPGPQPLRVPPAAPCVPARFATMDVAIYEIGTDCHARRVAEIPVEAEGAVGPIAWGSEAGPVVLAASSAHDDDEPDHLLLVEPRVGGKITRAVPPGKGAREPEGATFSLVSDGTRAYVERCRSWDSGDPPGGEDAEEWSCSEHLYYAVGATGPARPVDPAPQPGFTRLLAGTGVVGKVRLEDDGAELRCTLDGKTTALEHWVDGDHATVLVAPLGGDSFLLGEQVPGQRRQTARTTFWRLVRGCEVVERPGWDQLAVPGPGGLWYDGRVIHVGDGSQVVVGDDGKPLEPLGLAWAGG